MKKIIARIAILLIGVIGLAGGSFGSSLASASGSTPYTENCPAGVFCAWDGYTADPSQQRWVFPISVYGPPNHCHNTNISNGLSRWSSAYNGYNFYNGHALAVLIFRSPNCLIDQGYVKLHAGDAYNLGDLGSQYDNSEQSFNIVFQN